MRTKILFLLMLLLTGAASSFAQEGTCGEDLRWTLNNGTLTISGTGAMTDYKYNTTPWYSSRSSIGTVIIEEGVTGIGNYAFRDCGSLATVTIGKGVTSIKYDAFYDCTGLTTVNFNAESCTEMGSSYSFVFSGCTALTTLNIGDGVKTIPANAFRNCVSLPSVTIPRSVTSIGEGAFAACSNMTDIVVENGNTCYSSDGGVLFNLPKTSLICCPAGKSGAYVIPAGVTGVENMAFFGCVGLTELTIPAGVTSIEHDAFSNCSSLTSIVIPNSVTNIEYYAFSNCSKLASITLPLRAVGGAYYDAPRLGYIFYTSGVSTPPTGFISQGSIRGNIYTTYYFVPASLRTVNVTDSSDVKSTFFMRTNLVTVNMPHVKSIGAQAFNECGSLASVTVGDSLKSIGTQAFYLCGSLASVTVPRGVTSIGEQTFYRCSSLTRVSGCAGVTHIGDQAFYGCGKLASISFSGNMTAVGEQAFSDCSRLTSVLIPNAAVGANAFSGCALLDTVIVGKPLGTLFGGAAMPSLKLFAVMDKTCTSLSSGLLSGCSALAELTLPFIGISPDATGEYAVLGTLFGTSSATNAVTQYYEEGKSQKYAIPSTLQKLTVARPATRIRYGALYNCSMLQELTIASAVTGVDEAALHGCSGVTHIYAQRPMPPTAYDGIAYDVDAGCVVHIPEGSLEYYKARPGWKDFFFFDEEAEIVIRTQSVPLYGGAVNPSAVSCERNESVSFEVIPAMGYTFKGWMEDNSLVSVLPGYTFTATAPRTLYAVFTPRENADGNIQIQTSSRSATLAWTAVEDAANYLLVIYSDETRTEEIARFELDANGNATVRSAVQTLSCTVPDLSRETRYWYSLASYNGNSEALTVSAGDFTTATESGTERVSTNADFRIYPNPVGESFRIGGAQGSQGFEVCITDAGGRTVLRQTVGGDESVFVGRLPQGVYLVRVNEKTFKIIRN